MLRYAKSVFNSVMGSEAEITWPQKSPDKNHELYNWCIDYLYGRIPLSDLDLIFARNQDHLLDTTFTVKNIPGEDGKKYYGKNITPLQYALLHQDKELFTKLLQLGSDIKKPFTYRRQFQNEKPDDIRWVERASMMDAFNDRHQTSDVCTHEMTRNLFSTLLDNFNEEDAFSMIADRLKHALDFRFSKDSPVSTYDLNEFSDFVERILLEKKFRENLWAYANGGGDHAEKFRNMLIGLLDEVDARKGCFAEYDADAITYAKYHLLMIYNAFYSVSLDAIRHRVPQGVENFTDPQRVDDFTGGEVPVSHWLFGRIDDLNRRRYVNLEDKSMLNKRANIYYFEGPEFRNSMRLTYNAKGVTPLVYAALTGKTDAVTDLIAAGSDLNTEFTLETTSLTPRENEASRITTTLPGLLKMKNRAYDFNNVIRTTELKIAVFMGLIKKQDFASAFEMIDSEFDLGITQKLADKNKFHGFVGSINDFDDTINEAIDDMRDSAGFGNVDSYTLSNITRKKLTKNLGDVKNHPEILAGLLAESQRLLDKLKQRKGCFYFYNLKKADAAQAYLERMCNYFYKLKADAEYKLATPQQKLLRHAALGEWQAAAAIWKQDPSVLTQRGNVSVPGRPDYVNLTAWQIAWLNEEYEVVMDMAEHLSPEEKASQYQQIQQLGEPTDDQMKNIKSLLDDVVSASLKDNSNYYCMDAATQEKLDAFNSYITSLYHAKGIPLHPQVFQNIMHIIFTHLDEVYAQPNYDKQGKSVRLLLINVLEHMTSLMGTRYLRVHCQGTDNIITKQKPLTVDGCILAQGRNGSPYFTAEPYPQSGPGITRAIAKGGYGFCGGGKFIFDEQQVSFFQLRQIIDELAPQAMMSVLSSVTAPSGCESPDKKSKVDRTSLFAVEQQKQDQASPQRNNSFTMG